MKKVLVMFVAVALTTSTIFLGGCPQPKAKPAKVRFEVIQDQQSAFTGRVMPLPDWVLKAIQGNLLQYGTDPEGRKVVYFLLVDRGQDLKGMKRSGRIEIRGSVAEMIKSRVTSEAAKVFEGDEQTYTEYIQGAIGVLAKNIEVPPLVPTDEYWAELQEYVDDVPTQRFFSYVVRFQMDLNAFKQIVSGAWEKTKKQQPNIPEEARRKMERVIERLYEED